ncbi:MAG: lysophospholipid acyltransferase family protein [Gemmatimonadales bacterium]
MKIPMPQAVLRYLVEPLVSALAASWRMRVHGGDRVAALQAAQTPVVFLLWHETLLPLLWWQRGRGIAIVVSQGRDGQVLADYATRLGYRCIPGSSSRGAVRAFLKAVRLLDESVSVAFATDGPRGPRRVVKPGVVRAAQRAGAPIVPLHAVVRSGWHSHSWDRTVVPKPFTRVDVGYGEPFTIAAGEAGLGAGVAHAAAALEALEREMVA